MAISRMDMERQLRAGGGIMTLEEPRQGYFLGKIVKKAKKAVKKVVKSPLGKLALGAAALKFGGPGLAKLLGRPATGFLSGQFTGQGGIFSAAKGLFDSGNLLSGLVRDPTTGKFSLGRAALSGLGAASIAAPFFMGGEEEEVDEGTPFTDPQADIEDIRSQAKAYYSDPTNSALYFMPPRAAVPSSFYADGGLASLDTPKRGMVDGPGSYAGEKPGFLDNFLSAIGQIKSGQITATGDKAKEFVVKEGFGTNFDEDQIAQIIDMKNRGMDLDSIATIMEADPNEVNNLFSLLEQKAYGGRIGKAEGGLMDLGGLEKDYREGGFVPLGAEERADDVPARLSKNEFVFTADAVRNAGQGDIDKGAEVMQNMMDNLEAGGTISEESQGMENPAQEMFDQSQLLESRIA